MISIARIINSILHSWSFAMIILTNRSNVYIFYWYRIQAILHAHCLRCLSRTFDGEVGLLQKKQQGKRDCNSPLFHTTKCNQGYLIKQILTGWGRNIHFLTARELYFPPVLRTSWKYSPMGNYNSFFRSKECYITHPTSQTLYNTMTSASNIP